MSSRFYRLLSYPVCTLLSACQVHDIYPYGFSDDSSRTVFPINCQISPDVFSNVAAQSVKLIHQYMTIQGIPGVSACVRVNGQKIMSFQEGFADIETYSPMTENSVARIGSISKTVTALMFMALQDSGLLDISSPVNPYLEKYGLSLKYENKPVEITFHHLLSHMSGIRHYKEAPNCDMESEEFYSNKPFPTSRDALEFFIHDDLLSMPGTKYHYTTFGYTLLSFALEEAMDISFENILKSFTNSFGLKSLQLDTNSDVIVNRCKYYCKKDNKIQNSKAVDNSLKFAGGGMLCSIADLALIGDLLLFSYQCDNGCFGNREKFLKMFQPNDDSIQVHNSIANSYGLGLSLGVGNLLKGIQIPTRHFNFGHTGGAVGVTSCLLAFPSVDTIQDGKEPRGVVVAIFVNLENCSGIRALTEEIGKLFLERLAEYEKELEESYTTYLL